VRAKRKLFANHEFVAVLLAGIEATISVLAFFLSEAMPQQCGSASPHIPPLCFMAIYSTVYLLFTLIQATLLYTFSLFFGEEPLQKPFCDKQLRQTLVGLAPNPGGVSAKPWWGILVLVESRATQQVYGDIAFYGRFSSAGFTHNKGVGFTPIPYAPT
jgi:hypothetical protein